MTNNNQVQQKFYLDRVDLIELDVENPPIPIEPLKHLPVGMHFLAKYVRDLEIRVKNKENIDEIVDYNLLTNYFHWFANTSVNYLRYVALIDILNKNNWTLDKINETNANKEKVTSECNSYVEKVIPEIFKFRNKISAHYSSTAPRKNDNIALFEFSGLIPVGYLDQYFQIGIYNIVNNGDSSDIPQWALTTEFEKICDRYLIAKYKLPTLQ